METDFVPFSSELSLQAGELLANRHRRNRKRLPFLPARFEQPEVAGKAIEALLEKKTASGYAAVRNGQLVAYFVGEITVMPWGRCGWVHLPGSGLADGESASTLQDLYALLGEDWVKRGVFIHHTYFSRADEDLIDAWFGMDFGKERIDAILNFSQVEIPEVQVPDGIVVRRAGHDDKEHLASMSHLIFREYEKAPFWHPTPPEEWDELRNGWAELAEDETVSTWLALDGEKTVGTIASWGEEEALTDMLIGPKTFSFSVAATRTEYRGCGVGTALTWTCLAHGRAMGFGYCYTNWISPNLSASRFWPRFGFQEVAYRLTRTINPMISWTRIS